MNITLFLAIVASSTGLFPQTDESIIEKARSVKSFTLLLKAVEAAGLTETLDSGGPFTIFAPTDAAFQKLPPETVTSLLQPENREKLRSILLHHVTSGRVPAAKVLRMDSIPTLLGSTLTLQKKPTLLLEKAGIIQTDIQTQNGIIHVIDQVLLPPPPRFPSVKGDNLSRKTYRLPGDFEGDRNLVLIAFERYQQKEIDTWLAKAPGLVQKYPNLNYYELPTLDRSYLSRRWFIDGGMRRGIPDKGQRDRTITLYIDKGSFRSELQLPSEKTIYAVLTDQSGRVLWKSAGVHSPEKQKSLEKVLSKKDRTWEVIEKAGEFKTFLAALRVAGMEGALRKGGPYTIFAPTDTAFELLGKPLLEDLLLPENRNALKALLQNHLLAEKKSAADLQKIKRVKTVAGESIGVIQDERGISLEGARVTMADLPFSNGVLHGINTILIPRGK